MKLKHLLSGILFMSALAFTACKGKAKDMIVNKWKMTDMQGGVAASMPDSIKKNIISNTVIEFTKDGKYNTSGGGALDNGTYTVSEDGKTVTMVSAASGKSEPSDIDELTKSKLVITDKKSGTKVMMEPK